MSSSVIQRLNCYAQAKALYGDNAYHNISHVEAMLDNLRTLSIQDSAFDILYCAICFHDCVCVPMGEDNELLSANALLNSNVFNERIRLSAAGLIITTARLGADCQNYLKRNKVPQKQDNKLIHIMHDLDYGYFIHYAELTVADEQIKKEYISHISEEGFIKGRTKFLTELLYNTVFIGCFKHLEEQAKRNIKRLLKEKYGA